MGPTTRALGLARRNRLHGNAIAAALAGWRSHHAREARRSKEAVAGRGEEAYVRRECEDGAVTSDSGSDVPLGDADLVIESSLYLELGPRVRPLVNVNRPRTPTSLSRLSVCGTAQIGEPGNANGIWLNGIHPELNTTHQPRPICL